MVNVYVHSTVRRMKVAPVQQDDAAGYILETEIKGKTATLTKTIMLTDLCAETNQHHAELVVMAEAVKRIRPKEPVTIYTDDMFVASQFRNGNVQKWKQEAWLNAKKKPINHAEAWKKLLELLEERDVEWKIGVHHSYSTYLKDEVENKRECV